MYNPYANFNPYQQIQAQPSYTGQRQDLVRVNGKPGAEAYQMPPNSSALLLDESAPIVWLAQTDGAGYKPLSPYSITPYQPEPPVDVKSLVGRIERLEGLINDKPNSSSGRKNKSESD